MLPNTDAYIESIFPDLQSTGYTITSPRDQFYNCIGWAGSDNMHWWEPDPFYQYYWPTSVPRASAIEAYIMAYESLSYQVCDNSDHEEGYEKIVIYTDKTNGMVTHAARQLDSIDWTSKLGKNYDISHKLQGLNGDAYGTPEVFMKRIKA